MEFPSDLSVTKFSVTVEAFQGFPKKRKTVDVTFKTMMMHKQEYNNKSLNVGARKQGE